MFHYASVPAPQHAIKKGRTWVCRFHNKNEAHHFAKLTGRLAANGALRPAGRTRQGLLILRCPVPGCRAKVVLI